MFELTLKKYIFYTKFTQFAKVLQNNKLQVLSLTISKFRFIVRKMSPFKKDLNKKMLILTVIHSTPKFFHLEHRLQVKKIILP